MFPFFFLMTNWSQGKTLQVRENKNKKKWPPSIHVFAKGYDESFHDKTDNN